MAKFKIGDRIRLVEHKRELGNNEDVNSSTYNQPIGSRGVVTRETSTMDYWLLMEFEDGEEYGMYEDSECFELVSNYKKMLKIKEEVMRGIE